MSIGALFIAIFCFIGANFIVGAEKIDINTAPVVDLMKIIHIGEARARELISLRPFSSVDDLIRIKGIGEARIQDIKQQGLAWVGLLDVGGEASNMLEAKPPTSEPRDLIQEVESFEATTSVPAQKSPVFILVAGLVAVFSGAAIFMLKKSLR